METVSLAMHGWQVFHPAGWDVISNKGTWNEGQVLLAEGRHGRLALTWQRRARTPDIDRTLASINKRFNKEAGKHQSFTLASSDDLGEKGVFARWVGPMGDFHAAIIHHVSNAMTFILRELEPGDGLALKRVSLTCESFADDATCPWHIHNLDFTLPPWWRLEGLQNIVGLVRGVWVLQPGGVGRTAAVLSMRRFAMGDRLLQGDGLETWLMSRTNPKDVLEFHETKADGTVQIDCAAQLPGWYNWLRGNRQPRRYYAWREPEMDRILVQEWRGRENPLECLRPTTEANTGRSPKQQPSP